MKPSVVSPAQVNLCVCVYLCGGGGGRGGGLVSHECLCVS